MKMSSSEEEVLHIAEDVEAEEEEVSSEVMGEEVSSEVEEKEEESTVAEEPGDKLPQKIKGKGKQQLTAGVVYLSRIPPFMRPRKVRHLLSRYGDIGRVYLQPEDPLVAKRRRKFRKNRKRNYTEGWVEFTDKRVAKATAMVINNTQIGGKKRYYYHDDTWNMKYLSKFRWSHLTEKIAYEQAVHEQKMRLETSQVRKETSKYLENVERSKQVAAIVERKQKRGEKLLEHTQRRFRQRRVAETAASSSSAAAPKEETLKPALDDSLLMKILPGHR